MIFSQLTRNASAMVFARLVALSMNIAIIPLFINNVGQETFIKWESTVSVVRIYHIFVIAFSSTLLWKLLKSSDRINISYSVIRKVFPYALLLAFLLFFFLKYYLDKEQFLSEWVLIFLVLSAFLSLVSETCLVLIEVYKSPIHSAKLRVISLITSQLIAVYLLFSGFSLFALVFQQLIFNLLIIFLSVTKYNVLERNVLSRNKLFDRREIKYLVLSIIATTVIVIRTNLMQVIIRSIYGTDVFDYYLGQKFVNIVIALTGALTVPFSIRLIKKDGLYFLNKWSTHLSLIIVLFSWIFIFIFSKLSQPIFNIEFSEIENIFTLHIMGIAGVVSFTTLVNIRLNILGFRQYETYYVGLNSLFLIILLFITYKMSINIEWFTFLFYLIWIFSGCILYLKEKLHRLMFIQLIPSTLSLILVFWNCV